MQPQSSPTPDKPDKEPLLTSEEFKALVTQVNRNARLTAASRPIVFWIKAIGVGFSLFWWWRSGSAVLAAYSLFAASVFNLMPCILANFVFQDAQEVKRLLHFVESVQDVRQVGALLDLNGTARVQGEPYAALYTATDVAILRLLRLIQPTDAALLNTQQRECLRRHLLLPLFVNVQTTWGEHDYCLNALYALEQIGDKRDLPDVERLLKEYYITDEVRSASEHCAQTIRERVAREESKDVLLRADRKPEAVATLLRPSAENVDTLPQQLLRAASNEENTPA